MRSSSGAGASSASPVKSSEYFRNNANRSLTVCRVALPHRSPQIIRVQPPCEQIIIHSYTNPAYMHTHIEGELLKQILRLPFA